MALQISVEGYKAFQKAIKDYSGKTIFALFTGSLESNGKSWCPDCVTAEPVIEGCLSKLPEDAVFIVCGVGDRTYWKDQNNDFRKDPSLQLKGVPTLLKYGTPKKLCEEECAKSDLVDMLFTED